MRRQKEKKPKAFCPFCKAAIPKSALSPATPSRRFPGGCCACGVIFVSDLTGKNGGEALVEAVTRLCNDDLDAAWSLEEGEDYTVKIMSYESRTHCFNKRGHYKDGMARLYFVKRHEETDP